jgi:hypothetical protein
VIRLGIFPVPMLNRLFHKGTGIDWYPYDFIPLQYQLAPEDGFGNTLRDYHRKGQIYKAYLPVQYNIEMPGQHDDTFCNNMYGWLFYLCSENDDDVRYLKFKDKFCAKLLHGNELNEDLLELPSLENMTMQEKPPKELWVKEVPCRSSTLFLIHAKIPNYHHAFAMVLVMEAKTPKNMYIIPRFEEPAWEQEFVNYVHEFNLQEKGIVLARLLWSKIYLLPWQGEGSPQLCNTPAKFALVFSFYLQMP